MTTTNTSNWNRKQQLTLYFILAYAISWLIWSPVAGYHLGWWPRLVPDWWHLLGALGPISSAFIVTALSSGRSGLKDLLARMTRWRIGGWLAFALFSAPFVFLLSVLLTGLVSGDWSVIRSFGHVEELPGLGWLAGWGLHTLSFGLGEETGWRGFALPRFQARNTAAQATLKLGLLWAGWHIPLFTYEYTEMNAFGLLGFIVGMLAGAVVLTWLYNSTGGSILAVILWHGAYNASVAGAEGAIPMIVTAFVIGGAISIGRRYGPENFSARPRHTL